MANTKTTPPRARMIEDMWIKGLGENSRKWAKLGGRIGRLRLRSKAGPTMDVSILVETTFEDGETKRSNIVRLRRAPDKFASLNLGLLLDDAKTVLGRLQGATLQDQVCEAIEARRKCDGCGKQRAIHDDQSRILDTLFGRIQVKWSGLRRCLCRSAGIAKSGPQSPLAGMFSARTAPEFRRLQAELGARHSFQEAARLIEILLPCSAQLNTTVRVRLGRIADELGHEDASQGDTDTIALPPSLTVFVDRAHIRCRGEYRNATWMSWSAKLKAPM